MAQHAFLALADGTVWRGRAFGASGRVTGEVVFCTAMTGYQEVLTDPSYRRQIVTMTATHVGNTGVNEEDDESGRSWVAGFVVNQISKVPSSWRATDALATYLGQQGVPGIADVDTRALVRRLRTAGAMHGALVTDGSSADVACALAASAPDINRMDLVGEVTCREPYEWPACVEPAWQPDTAARLAARETGHATAREAESRRQPTDDAPPRPHAVVLDLGVKRNTLRMLVSRGCRVTVVPARTTPEQLLSLAPDGVLVSNGPGDPANLPDIVANLGAILGAVPVFGICLGHQVLGLALGGRTYKLKFGHRGTNQPVRDQRTGAVAISSHNHGFALDAESLPDTVAITHLNLNDGCVEGLAAPEAHAFSVQYHPEAAPGPHDAAGLFDAFLEAMSSYAANSKQP